MAAHRAWTAAPFTVMWFGSTAPARALGSAFASSPPHPPAAPPFCPPHSSETLRLHEGSAAIQRLAAASISVSCEEVMLLSLWG